MVCGSLFATLARFMGWNGRLLPIGFTSGEIPSLAMNLPLLKNYFGGRRLSLRLDGALSSDDAARASEAIMALVGEGKLRPRVDCALLLRACRRGDDR